MAEKRVVTTLTKRSAERQGPPPHVGGYAYLHMDKIIISDLEVFYRVGVPDVERAKPQRLLISVEMTRDFATAATADDLTKTIDYDAVARRLLEFGEGRSWKLIERLAADIAEMILAEFAPDTVSVEVKKFVVPEARYVAVQLTRTG